MIPFDTDILIPWYKDRLTGNQRYMQLQCIGYFDDADIGVSVVPENFPWGDKQIIRKKGYGVYEKDVFEMFNEDIKNEIYHQLEEYREYLTSHHGPDAMDVTREEAYEIRREMNEGL